MASKVVLSSFSVIAAFRAQELLCTVLEMVLELFMTLQVLLGFEGYLADYALNLIGVALQVSPGRS